MKPECDLSVVVGRVRMKNPVMNASGTMGYGHEWAELTRAGDLGAVVTKTVTAEPRAGNPTPRLWETPGGLINSIGLQNVGAAIFARDHLPRLCALGPPIIVSVGGNTADDYAACVARLDDAPVAAYEINISCPNVDAGGMEFGRLPAEAGRVVRGVRRATARPLWVKLSPNVGDLPALGRACLEEGADALTAINTYVGMVIDVERRRPRLPRGVGGVSGPAIRPLALARVWELWRALRCPLVGVGGIATAHDALEFLLAGAAAVQVGSAILRDPARAAGVRAGLRSFAAQQGIARLTDLVGALRMPGAAEG